MSVSREAHDQERRDRFKAIYEANYHRILGFALRRAPEAEAADVVAETFLAAWRRLEDVPPGVESRLWLYGTARRVLANQERARRRRSRLLRRAQTEPPCQVTECYSPTGGGEAARAFAALGERDREILALSAWEELDAAEIANVCGCSRNAARIRLHRARKRLAAELGRSEGKRPAGDGRQVGPVAKEESL